MVTFWDSVRFTNWLHNGQPTGAQGPSTTEDGAYTLTPAGIAANTIPRNPEATIFLPNEDEWYKAAYFDGTSYFDYPTGTDVPTACAAPGTSTNAANCDYAEGHADRPLSLVSFVPPLPGHAQSPAEKREPATARRWSNAPQALCEPRPGRRLHWPPSLSSRSEPRRQIRYSLAWRIRGLFFLCTTLRRGRAPRTPLIIPVPGRSPLGSQAHRSPCGRLARR